MSRLGKTPVLIPAAVTVTVNGRDIVVKGPKGELGMHLPMGVEVSIEDGKATVGRKSNSKNDRSCQGTVRRILGNNVAGVVKPFEKVLDIVGVGYTANVRGAKVALKVGYANEIELDIPPGITVTTPSATRIVVSGASREVVGDLAARIRLVRPPEPYNGKGIRYVDEHIQKKAGKSFASGG